MLLLSLKVLFLIETNLYSISVDIYTFADDFYVYLYNMRLCDYDLSLLI